MAPNYTFLTEPDDSLKCLICLEVASNPKQHEVCGKLFCTECLKKYGKKPCPNCRVENSRYFKDRRSLREIRDLRVKCYTTQRGCVWEGTVGTASNHVTKCEFTLVSCPNKCQVGSQLIRKDLTDHLKTSCLNREYQCEHCGEKGTFASITEEHDSVCIKKVVSCPNTECTLTMERGLTKKHVETVCSYTVFACKYVSIGCSMEKMSMDMKEHEEDDKSHLRLALEKIVKLEATTSVLQMNAYTLTREKWMTFKISGFGAKKENNEAFYSEPFYISPGGYKMCIVVDPNGSGDGSGTHVSVYSCLLEGPYKDNLSWPFLGTVMVELLNQLADNNHHSMKIPFNTIITKQSVGGNWVFSNFLPHTKLSHDRAGNTQYLVEDSLYFRVVVEVDHHKPWLDCTHHTK